MEAVMVVEVLSGHHRVRARHRFAAAGEAACCTVGRSVACDVVLDDPYVAAVHARITVDAEGRVTVTDLESVNGIEVGGLRRRGGEPAELDGSGVLRVGHTRLRVRTAREVVAPERADRSQASWWSRGAERNALAAGFVASIAVTAFQVWTTTTQPRELSTALVTTLLTLLGLAGLWIALWALASRVAFGESRWLRHATIVAVAYAGSIVAGGLLSVVNGALGLHLPSAVEPLLGAITVAAALSAHLVNASPMRVRFALALGVTIPAVLIAAIMWTQARGQNRSPSYVADRDQVVPPALVMRRGVSLERFWTEVTDLQPRADANRVFVEREDPSPDDDETD